MPRRHVCLLLASPSPPAHLNTFACRYDVIEEFMEAVTWLQLGYHVKPVGILNVNGEPLPLSHWLARRS